MLLKIVIFIGGLFIGTLIGGFVMSLCCIAGRESEIERRLNEDCEISDLSLSDEAKTRIREKLAEWKEKRFSLTKGK